MRLTPRVSVNGLANWRVRDARVQVVIADAVCTCGSLMPLGGNSDESRTDAMCYIAQVAIAASERQSKKLSLWVGAIERNGTVWERSGELRARRHRHDRIFAACRGMGAMRRTGGVTSRVATQSRPVRTRSNRCSLRCVACIPARVATLDSIPCVGYVPGFILTL